MYADTIIKGLFTALRLLTRLSVSREESQDSRLVLGFFPAVGLLLGLIVWGVATFLQFATNSLAATVLSAIVLPPLYWWLVEGRNLRGIIWTAAHWQLPDAEDEEENQYRSYWVLLAVQTLFLCRVAATGILVYSDKSLWLVVGPIVAMAAHAELVAAETPAPDSPPQWSLHWLLAAAFAIGVTSFLKSPLAGIFAVVLAWALTGFLARAVEAHCPKPTSNSHGAIREAVETVVMLIGILYFASPK